MRQHAFVAAILWLGTRSFAEQPRQDPVELVALKQEYATSQDRLRREAEEKASDLNAKYLAALDQLYQRYAKANDVRAMSAVLQWRRVVAPSNAPSEILSVAPQLAARFNWGVAKKGLKYRYREENFGRSTFDYTDSDCVKLLDGRTQEAPLEGAVAWVNVKPSLICAEFSGLVRPAIVRLHVFGNNLAAGYLIPETIRIHEGIRSGPTHMIGEVKKPEDRSGWVEVPLNLSRPAQFFWIEIDRSSARWVCLDEFEFR